MEGEGVAVETDENEMIKFHNRHATRGKGGASLTKEVGCRQSNRGSPGGANSCSAFAAAWIDPAVNLPYTPWQFAVRDKQEATMARRILLGIGLLLSVLFFAVACLVAYGLAVGMPASVGATLASGRTIVASARTLSIGIEYSNDVATVRTWGHTVVVEPTRLTIDGRPAGTIPANAKEVNLSIEGGRVTATADGRAISGP